MKPATAGPGHSIGAPYFQEHRIPSLVHILAPLSARFHASGRQTGSASAFSCRGDASRSPPSLSRLYPCPKIRHSTAGGWRGFPRCESVLPFLPSSLLGLKSPCVSIRDHRFKGHALRARWSLPVARLFPGGGTRDNLYLCTTQSPRFRPVSLFPLLLWSFAHCTYWVYRARTRHTYRLRLAGLRFPRLCPTSLLPRWLLGNASHGWIVVWPLLKFCLCFPL